MPTLAFAGRNRRELLRDPLTLAFGLGFTLVLLYLLSAIQRNVPVPLFAIDHLAPGVAAFGLTFIALFSAMLVSKDRSQSFMMRLRASPMQPSGFILGYLLYASMFAAVGSAVENEGDSQQLQMPLTIPLMIAYFIILMAFQNPDSGVVVWGSMIPFTSPIVMLARIPYGVPMWQLVVSIVLLLVTFFGCAWLSAKIYKVGILMFGKKSTFKDLWKWLRMK